MKLKLKEPDGLIQEAAASRGWKESLTPPALLFAATLDLLDAWQGLNKRGVNYCLSAGWEGPQEALCQWLLNIH